MDKEDTEVILQPTPLTVRFPEDEQHVWQQQQEILEELDDEAAKNADALLHP